MSFAAWSIKDRPPLNEILGLLEYQRIYDLPDRVLLEVRRHPLLVQDGRPIRISENLTIQLAGHCLRLAELGQVYCNVIWKEAECLRGWRSSLPMQKLWDGQAQVIADVWRSFFFSYDMMFGWFNILFAHRPKRHRQHEDPNVLSHQIPSTGAKIRSLELRKFWLWKEVGIPIERLRWQVRPNCYPATLNRNDILFHAAYPVSLAHSWLKGRTTAMYTENRLIPALHLSEVLRIAEGAIPLFEYETDDAIQSECFSRTIFVSLNRVDRNLNAFNITIEVDPRSYGIISIRYYRKSIGEYLALASAVDQVGAYQAMVEFFQ